MGKGTRYEHVDRALRRAYRGGRVLEVGAGNCNYRDLFDTFVGTDVPATAHADVSDLDVLCDGRFLPFAPRSFELIFMVGVLHIIPNPGQVCREAWKCLNEGGQLIVFDYTRSTIVRNLTQQLDQGGNPGYNIWDQSGLTHLMADSGFREICRISERLSPAKRLLEKGLFRFCPTIADRKYTWLMLSGTKPHSPF